LRSGQDSNLHLLRVNEVPVTSATGQGGCLVRLQQATPSNGYGRGTSGNGTLVLCQFSHPSLRLGQDSNLHLLMVNEVPVTYTTGQGG
jgi:hypothetical protein